MKAILLNEKGPADRLWIGEVADPIPGPSDVIVRVFRAGVNHGDIIRRERGMFPPGPPPYILGLEGAGVIAAKGAEVESLSLGQRVAFLTESGGYSQLAKVPCNQVFPIPAEVSDTLAAASVCAGLTAWHLVRIGNLQPGNTVLVHGGAGGVGSVLTQVCKQKGAVVYTTVGSEEKALFAKDNGADRVINYRTSDFSEEVLKYTNGEGVEIIYDCIGAAVQDGNMKSIRRGGRLFYFGSASGHASFPGNIILNKSLLIEGFAIFELMKSLPLWKAGVGALLSSLINGTIKIHTLELPMKEAQSAHRLLEDRMALGKVVLNME